MPAFLILAFLFCIGSTCGWGIEVLFRKFFSSSNPQHRWINPGFLTGPYLPLYGSGLVILYLIALLETHIGIADPVAEKAVLFCVMAVCMTGIEYIAGILCLKIAHIRLWDYSGNRGNIQGLICPLFSFFWTVLGAIYYFFIHPHILDALAWLSNNLAFSFFIGFFYGIFVLDLARTTRVVVIVRRFAAENQIIVHYEELRERIRQRNMGRLIRTRFLLDMLTVGNLKEHLEEYREYRHEQLKKRTENIKNRIGK